MAEASGPTERLQQVLVHPSAPNVVVLRYAVPQGGASHGFLFSRDGGASFQALCSEGVAPDAARGDRITKISTKEVPSAAAVVLDAAGRVVFSQLDGLWSDDGTGCSWAKQEAIGENWAYSLIVDPKDPAALLGVVTTRSADGMEARAELMRRDPSGAWSVLGALKPHTAQQRVFSGELIGAPTETSTRLYATANIAVGALSAPATELVLASDDGGKTWREVAPVPAASDGRFVLLAVDPRDPNRVLATVSRSSANDTLLLSEDQGATFQPYGELVTTSGVTFAPDGRVYVGDAGDDSTGDKVGGVWTAARLGDPLTRIESTRSIDCLHYDAASSKLQVCMRTRFGKLDPTSGTFEEAVSLQTIESLLTCPSLDTAAVCEAQLNQGSSWCCAGHYPFTPFCGQYDVTESNGRPVLCGVSGREYESGGDAGAGPADAGVRQDAGAATRDGGALRPNPPLDASTPGTDDDDDGAGESAGKGDDGGCAVRARPPSSASAGGALASVGILLLAVGRSLRRRRKR